MVTKEAIIINETGLHARPASNFINEAKKYQSKITVQNLTRAGTKAVNAKSIMMVLSLTAVKGTRVAITAEGADEEQAVNALVGLVEAGLGE